MSLEVKVSDLECSSKHCGKGSLKRVSEGYVCSKCNSKFGDSWGKTWRFYQTRMTKAERAYVDNNPIAAASYVPQFMRSSIAYTFDKCSHVGV